MSDQMKIVRYCYIIQLMSSFYSVYMYCIIIFKG